MVVAIEGVREEDTVETMECMEVILEVVGEGWKEYDEIGIGFLRRTGGEATSE